MRRLLGAVSEEVDMAVITPGAREQMVTGGGIQRGTWKGELTRKCSCSNLSRSLW
jgi:hypothetical protein